MSGIKGYSKDIDLLGTAEDKLFDGLGANETLDMSSGHGIQNASQPDWTGEMFEEGAAAAGKVVLEDGSAVASQSMAGATFTVTNTNDSGAGSLRQAILDANASAGADTIVIDPSIAGSTITLTSGQISITDDLFMDAQGITVSGNNANRVFTISGTGTEVEIENITVTDGKVSSFNGTTGGGAFNIGAGASLDLSNALITGNSVSTRGNAQGGAIRNFGDIELENVTFTDNVATGISSGSANGGAIYNAGTAVYNHITVTGNSVSNGFTGGGGITNLTSSTVTMTNSIVIANFRAGVENNINGKSGNSAGNLLSSNGAVSPADVFAALDSDGIGMLADNGGLVLTMALLDSPNNPALDRGAAIAGLLEDAAGNARDIDISGVNNGGTADAGAFELVPVPPKIELFDDASASNSLGGFADFPSALAAAGAGNLVWVLDAAAIGDVGAQTVMTENLTIEGDAPFDGTFTLAAGVNDLTLSGTTSADIVGNANANTLIGGDGDNTLSGDTGDDLLNGGAGADDLNGGGGFDTASYADDAAGVIFNIDSATRDGVATRTTLDGSGSTDTLTFIESAIGSAFDDSLWGNFLRNTLEGGDGNDSLYGRGGNDTLIGGLGNDLLNGASGLDTVSYENDSGAVIVDFVNGTALQGDGLGSNGIDTLIDIESFIGSQFDDTVTGSLANERFFGGNGADEMNGGAGNDTIYGEAADDILTGGDGNDRLYGGDDADTLNGDAGVDILDGGLGNDIINGGADGDRIFGREGDDTINGGSGVDIINAQEGNDILNGGDDRDFLRGNDGDDTISGDGGDDRIDGGADTDTVVYAGNQADYNIILRANGVLSVEDLNTANGDEGYDVITNAEFLQFADGIVDISGL